MAEKGCVYCDTHGNLLDLNFELVTTKDDSNCDVTQLPLTTQSKTYSHFRVACLLWMDRTMASIGKYILPQPMSLFFSRPLPLSVINRGKVGSSRMQPSYMLQIENQMSYGTPFDSSSVFDGSDSRRPKRLVDCIRLSDNWRSWNVASFPNPEMYDTFEQFEKACDRWVHVVHDSTEQMIQEWNEREVVLKMQRKRASVARLNPLSPRDGMPASLPPSMLEPQSFSTACSNLTEKGPAVSEEQSEKKKVAARAARMRETQDWFMHPSLFQEKVQDLVIRPQRPENVFRRCCKQVECTWGFNPSGSVTLSTEFTAKLNALAKKYSTFVNRKVISVQVEPIDPRVREYERYGCTREVKPAVPVNEGALQSKELEKSLRLPFTSLDNERMIFNDLLESIAKQSFRHVNNIASLYRACLAFHTFVPHKIPLIDPNAALIQELKSTPTLEKVYRLFFRCYLLDMWKSLLIEAKLDTFVDPIHKIGIIEKTDLVTFLTQKGFVITSEINSRALDPTFGILLGSLLCIATLFDSEIIDQFVSVSFSPFLIKLTKLSEVSLDIFHKIVWAILSDSRIYLAFLTECVKTIREVRFELPEPILDFLRLLFSVDENFCPKQLYQSTNWVIPLLALLLRSRARTKSIPVVEAVTDLIFRLWHLNGDNSDWADSVTQVQSLLLGMMFEEQASPSHTRLLVQAFGNTISCVKSLDIFRIQSAPLSSFAAALASTDKTISDGAWSVLCKLFSRHPAESLELTTDSRFRGFVFPLLAKPELRVQGLHFLVYAVSTLESSSNARHSRFRRSRSTEDALREFIQASQYNFLWYYTKKEFRKSRESWKKKLREIRALMRTPFVDKVIRSVLKPELKAFIAAREKQRRRSSG